MGSYPILLYLIDSTSDFGIRGTRVLDTCVCYQANMPEPMCAQACVAATEHMGAHACVTACIHVCTCGCMFTCVCCRAYERARAFSCAHACSTELMCVHVHFHVHMRALPITWECKHINYICSCRHPVYMRVLPSI